MNISFEQWSAGQGVVRHDKLTQERILDLLAELER